MKSICKLRYNCCAMPIKKITIYISKGQVIVTPPQWILPIVFNPYLLMCRTPLFTLHRLHFVHSSSFVLYIPVGVARLLLLSRNGFYLPHVSSLETFPVFSHLHTSSCHLYIETENNETFQRRDDQAGLVPVKPRSLSIFFFPYTVVISSLLILPSTFWFSKEKAYCELFIK